MASAAARDLKRQIAGLRREWRNWRNAIVQDPFRTDAYIVCPVTQNRYRRGEPVLCGDPTCEACGAALYRFGRMTEIEAQARPLKAALEALGA